MLLNMGFWLQLVLSRSVMVLDDDDDDTTIGRHKDTQARQDGPFADAHHGLAALLLVFYWRALVPCSRMALVRFLLGVFLCAFASFHLPFLVGLFLIVAAQFGSRRVARSCAFSFLASRCRHR